MGKLIVRCEKIQEGNRKWLIIFRVCDDEMEG